MRIIFDINQQYFRHKGVGGHVMDSSKHTTYSLTIKDIYVRLILMIAVKNRLGLMSGDIGNSFFKAP